MKSVWIAALVISLCASVSADTSKFAPPDPRLEKKITIEVDHTKLEDVVKSLSEQSGVTVKAGTGTRDWKVRERHVTIRAKDMPVGKMLDEIVGVLGYYLSREGKEGEWTYIIWQDKKSRDLEAEMVTAAKESAAQRAKETRQSAVDAANKALKMTPAGALKNRDKDPLGAYMGGTKSGRGFAQLLSSMQSQFPTEYDLMMRGKRAFVPITGLPPNLSQATADATSGGLGAAIRGRAGKDAPDLTPHQMIFMPFDGSGNMEASLMGISGLMFITGLTPGQKPTSDGNPFGGGQPMGMLALAGQDAPFGKLFGKALLAIEDGVPLDEVNKQINSEVESSSFLADSLARKSPTEETPPTDPKLTREIEIDTKDLPAGIPQMMSGGRIHESQGKAAAEISRALGMPVLLESHNMSMPIALFIKPGKQPVYKVLVALEKAAYKWSLGEDALRIRPEDWALKRSYEIPESYLAYYRKLMETQGELTLDDLAQMASTLTDEQIQNTLSKDDDLSYAVGALGGGGFLGGDRDILRLYAALTPGQKEALNTESGLAFGQLNDAQWEHMSAVITDRLGGLDITDGSVLLRPQPEDEVKRGSLNRTFQITVQVNGEQEPRKITQTVHISSKNQIAQIKESRRKAQEAMQKAAEQKKAAQTPPPAQTQPSPAK